jgi:hypothetical protein
MGRIYTTFQGKQIDMDRLLQQNETMPAVGNVRVNARGDELGPDGRIIRTRESVLSEYYDTSPNPIVDEEVLGKVKISSRRQLKEQEEVPTNVTKPKIKDSK